MGEPASLPASDVRLDLELPYLVDARPRATTSFQQAAEDEELARWNVGGGAAASSPANPAAYHPGTRVVVDARLARLRQGARRSAVLRGLTLDRVQAQTRAHGYWPFRLCFEAGQRQKPGAGGETRVAFTIGLRGTVRAARLLDSRLQNPTSAACLVHEVLRLEFSPPPPRALAVVLSIQLWPGDADLATLPTGSAPATTVGGNFDPSAVRARVAEKQSQLARCFSDAQRADPTLWGRLALLVVAEVDGSVHRVSETESHFPSPSAVRCAQVLLANVQFPSVDGKPLSFVVPMRLGPAGSPFPASSDSIRDPSSPNEGAHDDAGSD
jgi:hypothetical protein